MLNHSSQMEKAAEAALVAGAQCKVLISLGGSSSLGRGDPGTPLDGFYIPMAPRLSQRSSLTRQHQHTSFGEVSSRKKGDAQWCTTGLGIKESL